MSGSTLPPPSGGAGGGTGKQRPRDNEIAQWFGVNPYTLTDEEYTDATRLIDLSASTGIPLEKLILNKELQDAGLVTPSLSQKLLGLDDALGGGGSGTRLASDDPRYWDIQYRQLEQELLNSGLDAESARRTALATIITNQKAQSVDLARTSGDIAKTAAEFAANPRDAVADLMYRNAVGGTTPYGSIDNPAFGDLQTGLANKFQELFGGVAGDLSRAREFVGAPIPSEYLSPQLNIPTPSLMGAAPPVTPNPSAVPVPSFEDQGRIRDAYARDPQQAEAFFKMVTELNNGVPPTTAEDGVNMNITQPAMVIGMDGRVYATLAESDPEQLIVKPLPSVKERKKKEKDAQKNFMQATQGAQRMQGGGTINAIPSVADFMEELRKSLSSLGGTGGGVGGYSSALPSPRLLVGEPARLLSEDPDLAAMTEAGFSSLGISPDSLNAILKKYRPADTRTVASTIPKVAFA